MKVEADGVVVSRRNKTFIYQACPLCMRKLFPLQNESDSMNKSFCWNCKVELEREETLYCYHLALAISDGNNVVMVTVFNSCLDDLFGLTAKDFSRLDHDWRTVSEAVDSVILGQRLHLQFNIKTPTPELRLRSAHKQSITLSYLQGQTPHPDPLVSTNITVVNWNGVTVMDVLHKGGRWEPTRSGPSLEPPCRELHAVSKQSSPSPIDVSVPTHSGALLSPTTTGTSPSGALLSLTTTDTSPSGALLSLTTTGTSPSGALLSLTTTGTSPSGALLSLTTTGTSPGADSDTGEGSPRPFYSEQSLLSQNEDCLRLQPIGTQEISTVGMTTNCNCDFSSYNLKSLDLVSLSEFSEIQLSTPSQFSTATVNSPSLFTPSPCVVANGNSYSCHESTTPIGKLISVKSKSGQFKTPKVPVSIATIGTPLHSPDLFPSSPARMQPNAKESVSTAFLWTSPDIL